MIETPTYIENHELVLNAFGHWPSFHDAEIISITLDRIRELASPMLNSRLDLTIHCWEMTSEVDAKGFYKLIKHNLIRFEFDMVHSLELHGFNQQNAIFGLIFSEVPAKFIELHCFEVTIEPAFGLCGNFKATKGRVLSITPHTAPE